MAPAIHDTLRAIMGAYLQGDLEPLMAIISDDFVWDSNARRSQFRFGGVFKGRVGLQEALSLIASEFAMLKYDVHELVGDADTVWALSEVVLSEHKTGKRATFRLANRWQFRDGKLISLTEFFDTAGVLADLKRL
ncbi:MAG TPA: nuclear transport factor 2 family protein [Rhizomicrobium sp.]|nr:nuclear transport factor 2 family protein [Rhizomicrobium sp.]